jgi:hypothetical protein
MKLIPKRPGSRFVEKLKFKQLPKLLFFTVSIYIQKNNSIGRSSNEKNLKSLPKIIYINLKYFNPLKLQ